MHLTVVILAGSNQLFLNSFLLHKNKELANLTKRLSHPSKPPQQKRDKPRHKNILLSFFFPRLSHILACHRRLICSQKNASGSALA